jgi:hypothetical protein
VDQRGSQVYDLTKTRALFIDETVVVGSHGGHGTTPRSYLAPLSMGVPQAGTGGIVATDLQPVAEIFCVHDGAKYRPRRPLPGAWTPANGCGGDIECGQITFSNRN